MNMGIIEKTKDYIINRDRFGIERKFLIVDSVPPGYFVWGIGEHAPEGFIPLCVCKKDFEVDVDSLMALPVENEEDRRKILDAALWGGDTLSGAVVTLDHLKDGGSMGWGESMDERAIEILESAIPALSKINWRKPPQKRKRNYKVELRYSGSYVFEIQAKTKEEAVEAAYREFEVTDDRELVANIDDIQIAEVSK